MLNEIIKSLLGIAASIAVIVILGMIVGLFLRSVRFFAGY